MVGCVVVQILFVKGDFFFCLGLIYIHIRVFWFLFWKKEMRLLVGL